MQGSECVNRTERLRLAAILAGATIAGDAVVQAPAPPAEVLETIRELVRKYLVEHPEMAEQALVAFNAKRAKSPVAPSENGQTLLAQPMSPDADSPGGGVTLVEFFDHQSGNCNRSRNPAIELLAGNASQGRRRDMEESPASAALTAIRTASPSAAPQPTGSELPTRHPGTPWSDGSATGGPAMTRSGA